MEFAETSMLIRGSERLMALAIGCFCIWLGYRLFLALPEKPNESTGKFEGPGGISIHISRVGPGVFFALFGAGIVLMSLFQTLTLGVPQQAADASPQAVYLADQHQVPLSSEERFAAQRDIRSLLQLEQRAAEADEQLALTSRERVMLQLVLPRARRALTLESWDPAWGEPQPFRTWLQQGEGDEELPAALSTAIDFYRGGQP